MSRTRMKFCGVMRPQDAAEAAAAGADAVGMILHANARRRIDLVTAGEIVRALPPFVAAVGVFVNAPVDVVREAVDTLSLAAVQLHGDESVADVRRLGRIRVVKALRADTTLEAAVAAWRSAVAAGEVPNLVGLLIDGPGAGGTGEANDFARLRAIADQGGLAGLPPLIVAGGLTPDNVGNVVRDLKPFAVDTSSGIEAAFGEKSAEKMRAFANAVRTAGH